MRDVRHWLDSIGLGRYGDAFEENAVGWDHLLDLDHDVLREIGVGPVGHRMTILKAASRLRADATAPADAVAAGPSASPGEAERRQLTVMFCDLVGSTALSRRLDPEEYREVLTGYQSAAAGALQRYGGYIARYMGDGLLVYFGYPQAHEDDAERAVRAGLEVVEAVRALRPREGVDLQVRIGVATGLVVAGDIVGEGASEERAVLGETPNLAARLQGIAQPGTVVLAEATRRLVEGRFVLEALVPRALKGIDGAVTAYRAVAVGDTTRFEAATARGLSAMTGREGELALLAERWRQSRAGRGRVVLLSGEPGIGKSRLVRELRDRIETNTTAVLQFQCSPYHTGSAFHPIVDQLRRAAGFALEDSADARRRKLAVLVERAFPETEPALPLLAALLSLPTDSDRLTDMTPQRQKAETIRVLVDGVEQQATTGPVLVSFEDVHWVDPSTREMLDALIERIHSMRALCLVTHRPEFEAGWTNHGHVTSYSLGRLAGDEAVDIVTSVTGGMALPDEVLAQILERTDGVPLFVEELTKTVLEAGILQPTDGGYRLAGPLPSLSIPATLHDSLLARLDRLASAKEIAQTAACIGREFSPDLLAAVSSLDRHELDGGLEQLVGAQLVTRRDAGGRPAYAFNHALVQDAAYESLLRSRRRAVHARIAGALTEQFPETVASVPERLAQHYTAAGMAAEAIPCWLAAGRRALAGWSLPEAISHLTKALETTASIDDAHERAERELEARTALGAAIMAQQGWPAVAVREVVRPACDLIERGHGGPDAFMNLWNLWVHHGCRAEHREGLTVVERMLRHSRQRQDRVLALVSSFAAAMANYWVGNYDVAQDHERSALALYDFDRDRTLVHSYNHDPKDNLLSWASHRVWAQGFPDRARALSDEAVAHARQLGHAFNLCWTLGNSSVVYAHCGDYEQAYARVDELRQLAREQELLFMDAYMVPVNLCVIAALEGDHGRAYAEGVRAEEIWRGIGGRFWSPVVRSSMASACLHLGRGGEAVELIDGVVDELEATGERMLAEEVYRVAGVVHLEHDGDPGPAMELFRKSFDYSNAHGTRSFALRTAICVARLWEGQGRRREAHHLLAPLHAAFTEGLDTADLRQAAALVDALA